jgi:hypothetical protein
VRRSVVGGQRSTGDFHPLGAMGVGPAFTQTLDKPILILYPYIVIIR